jgi:protein arginine kinase activator
MLCEQCGAESASVHLTQIVDNEMRTLHLCERCAAKKGVEGVPVPEHSPLVDLLTKMGVEAPSREEIRSAPPPCGFCGLTLRAFRETGRVGCPHCWSTFDTHLRALIRRIHGSTQHVGKVYLPPDPSASVREKRLEALRKKLGRAVELEDFERAAEIRDLIRDLEPQMPG